MYDCDPLEKSIDAIITSFSEVVSNFYLSVFLLEQKVIHNFVVKVKRSSAKYQMEWIIY